MKNAIYLAQSFIRANKLNAFLSALSIACAIALLCLLLITSKSIDRALTSSAGGIDMVVGANGSGLQLVLSTLYHLDVPTGNIPADTVKMITRHPQVERVTPLALGDNYKGFRVVGTSADYLDLYKAKIAQGAVFQKPYEIVAGAETGLKIGDRFAGSHGFSAAGDVHEENLFTVVGVLERGAGPLDRLLITPIESVQDAHAHHDHGHDHHEEEADITAILVDVKSPSALLSLPRQINRNNAVMAAVPAYEMARLSSLINVGEKTLLAISSVVFVLTLIMLFSVLSAALAARRYDLAVVRALGASPWTVSGALILEGAMIAALGAGGGLLLAHLGGAAAGYFYPGFFSVNFLAEEIWFVFAALIAGAFAALGPALSVYKLDIASILAGGK